MMEGIVTRKIGDGPVEILVEYPTWSKWVPLTDDVARAVIGPIVEANAQDMK